MSCKKVKFIDEDYAESYIKKLNATSKRSVKPVRSYLCPLCLSWHITSRKQSDDLLIVNLKTKIAKQKRTIELLKEKNREQNYIINKHRFT